MNAEVRVEIQIAGDATGLPGDDEIRNWLERTIDAVAPEEGRSVELVVRVVDEHEIRELNSRFRHQDKATNVLAFPAAPLGEFPGVTPETGEELGDIVLCGAVIAREAREQDKNIAAHWGHMLVHGTLHLLGYDHGTDKDAARMERLESRILAGRGFDDPYATR
jgi:probable rRNA maturation factor